jgi:hypothetical protein
MSVVAKALFDAKYAQSTDNTEYTTAASTHTIIDKFTATNTDASAQTIQVNLIASGGSVGSSNIVIKALSIAAGVTTDITQLQNHILNPGDVISCVASAASKVVIRASGREVT